MDFSNTGILKKDYIFLMLKAFLEFQVKSSSRHSMVGYRSLIFGLNSETHRSLSFIYWLFKSEHSFRNLAIILVIKFW